MEFLLEIITEEMPGRHITSGLEQLKSSLSELFSAQKIKFRRDKLISLGTCRRLTLIGELAPEQDSEQVEIIGPPSSVAFYEDGSPTAAARGFAAKQRVDVDKLEVINTKKGEYIGLRKIIKGRPTSEVLEENLPALIAKITFPKMMRWGNNPFRFSRPIKNILCLCGAEKLSFSVGGITASAYTYGHRIHAFRLEKVDSLSQYKLKLKTMKVVLSPEKRKNLILKQIEKKLKPYDAHLLTDDQLLEKLIYDVEYPFVFLGEFPEKYLKLPVEVLSTAMKVGQNLFSVLKGKKQLPYFIGVADCPKDPKGYIRKGNERVLKARLEDARFFWEQDLKEDMKSRSSQLHRILFQEKLGTYANKATRLKKIVSYLADKLDLGMEKSSLITAADLCKADLLTEMVREFSSLQGKIGGLYSRKNGFQASVWKAIYEHYQPQSMDDSVPTSLSGSILSLADKLDTIIGVSGLGVEVSGSKDPFGLRRNAQGICKIIMEKKFSFSFFRLIDKVLNVYGDVLTEPRDNIKEYCYLFFKDRLDYIYSRLGYSYDVVDAALAPGFDNIYYSYLRLKALGALKESNNFEPMILIAKRVNNIIKEQPVYHVNSGLFFEKEERDLYTTFQIIKDNILPLIAKGDFIKAQRMVLRISSSINNFFDQVLVMDENKRFKRNRIGLLQEISKLFNLIADYSRIVLENPKQ